MHRATPRFAVPLLLAALAAGATAQTRLELGKMWLFENPPLGYLKDEYGFEPTAEWLQALRLASLRFGNWCSASFVSPKGLILTNHHCVRDQVAEASPPDTDWVENGFYATSLDDEVKLDGVSVSQLVQMIDVTDRMLSGIEEGDDDQTAESKRKANEEQILESAHQEHPDLTPEIVTLHQGAAYHLYLYNVYDDVRLVCTPNLQTAHFGGDFDNFTYPRYCLDFAFCRAWKDGKPADTSANYFKWSHTGAEQGQLVFVTGNPGSTGRLLTYAQMESMRDAYYPLVLGLLRSRVEILKSFVKQNPMFEQRFRTVILGDENSVKALTGYLAGLQDEELMAKKREFEQQFRSKVQNDPTLAERYGDAWDRLAEISAERTEAEPKAQFQVPGYSTHLARALAIVKAVDPNASDEDRATAKETALSMEVQLNPLMAALLVDHLQRAQKWLPKDDPFLQALIGDAPATEVVRQLSKSEVGDDHFVRGLLDGGREAVEASDDFAIVAARAIAPLVDRNTATMERLDAEQAAEERKIGQALYAVYGQNISPDATMTLRFSDGVVKGYDYNGTRAPWRTSFYGLYGRNVDFGGEAPFELPEIWHERKDRIDMSAPIDFVSTNDIIGGNSGSPVVNRDLEVVGLIFDGNIEQLPNRFLYRDDTQRSVSVHVRGIVEALTEVYEADRVLEELQLAVVR